MLVDLLSNVSGLERSRIFVLAETADRAYKKYEIPKRNSSVMRTIYHPSRYLKWLQRLLVDVIIKFYPIHQSATAYKKGCNIRKNAEFHIESNYTNRYDFADFFPSFKVHDIKSFFMQKTAVLPFKLTSEDVNLICKILCRNGELTIGAPSSPWITNIMMYEFDIKFNELCRQKSLVYTRYADDIFVSSKDANCLNNIDKEIIQIISDIDYLPLQLKAEKTAYLSKKYKRSITGLNITPDRKISIGRNKKREIKSFVYQFKNGKILDEKKINKLKGYLAYINNVEPSFLSSLEQKYGEEIIYRLFRKKY